jgi:hypothetical protein
MIIELIDLEMPSAERIAAFRAELGSWALLDRGVGAGARAAEGLLRSVFEAHIAQSVQ